RRLADVAALVKDASPGRAHEFGQQVETGRLAGAIWPDQRVDRAARNAQIDPIDRNETGKFFGEVLGLKDKVIAHGATAPLVNNSVSTARTRPAKKDRGLRRQSCRRAEQETKKVILMRRKGVSHPPPARLRLSPRVFLNLPPLLM